MTNEYEGMIAETIAVQGEGGTFVHAYFARPAGPGPYPGMVLFHHRPGWDEFYKETTRRFAHHGYLAISPDLYCRSGHGAPDDMSARVRAEGDISDAQVVGDGIGSIEFLRALPTSNGKVGLIGSCSGGRHAYLVGCQSKVEAVIDCWGGRVVMAPDELNDKYPVAPIDLTKDLSAPILGLFGEEDRSPSPEQVAQLEEALKQHGKIYEFHNYPGAGHAFLNYDRPSYRIEQAVDAWEKIWAFLGKHLN